MIVVPARRIHITQPGGIVSLGSILGLLKSLKIRLWTSSSLRPIVHSFNTVVSYWEVIRLTETSN